MEKLWSITAAICVFVAVVFFWFGNLDATFTTAVLGCVAWIVSYRFKVKNATNK